MKNKFHSITKDSKPEQKDRSKKETIDFLKRGSTMALLAPVIASKFQSRLSRVIVYSLILAMVLFESAVFLGFNHFVSLNYLWINCLMFYFGFIILYLSDQTRKTFDWKVFSFVFGFHFPLALIWAYWCHYYDPLYHAWDCLDFHTIGFLFGLSIEDILFFSGSIFFFYIMLRWVNTWKCLQDDFRYHIPFKLINIIVVVLVSSFFIYHTKLFGQSIAIMYMMPVFLIMAFKSNFYLNTNFKKFFVFLLIMWPFEFLWNEAAVSWIRYFVSYWCGWFYESWSADGVRHFSRLMYQEKWWHWESPVEITFYGMCGVYCWFFIMYCDYYKSKIGNFYITVTGTSDYDGEYLKIK